MLAESRSLDEKIASVQAMLPDFPDGTFICARNGSYCKWYRSDGHQKTYIPKSNRSLAEQLASKKYHSLLLADLLQKKKAVDFYLRHYPTSPGRAEQLLSSQPSYHELLASYFTLPAPDLADWANAPYESNPKYREYLVHRTASGRMVRSKSEALIDLMLYTNKIPFRYECALSLGELTLYPDFTILHPSTRELYYWEHFGRMDDPVYAKNACSKIQLYTAHGYLPSVRLITTYESQENPLNSDYVSQLISYYFL